MKRSGKWIVVSGLFGLLTALVGCGGGGGDAATPISEPATASVSGVVADGYLVGATVFSDRNGNRAWDAGEPKTTTAAGGRYTLTGEEIDLYPLVVLVEAGVTIDEDRPELPVDKSYTLLAPVGQSAFISPLTTLVQGQIEKGKTVSDAETFIKTALGVPSANLFANYMADAATADSALQIVAQKVAQIFGILHEADNGSSTPVDLISHILDVATGELPTIGSAPESYEPEAVLGFTNGMVAGKTFIGADGIGENERVIITTYHSDGTYSEWANDGETSLATMNGNWSISNGQLLMNDSLGSITLTLQSNTGTYIDALVVAEGPSEIARIYKAAPFTNELLAGKTFNFLGNGPGTITLNSDGTGSMVEGVGSENITWSIADGVLSINTGKFFLYAGGTAADFKMAGYDFDDMYIGTVTMSLP